MHLNKTVQMTHSLKFEFMHFYIRTSLPPIPFIVCQQSMSNI